MKRAHMELAAGVLVLLGSLLAPVYLIPLLYSAVHG